jgi:hypothetical protein
MANDGADETRARQGFVDDMTTMRNSLAKQVKDLQDELYESHRQLREIAVASGLKWVPPRGNVRGYWGKF